MYYVYKITNTVTQQFYIGVHKTANLNDGYMGSGVRIKQNIEEYGLDVFTKDILFSTNVKDEAYVKEKELITEMRSQKMLNLHEGGCGGFEYIQSLNLPNPMYNEKSRQRMIDSRKKTHAKDPEKYKCISKNNLKKAHEKRVGSIDSEETKEKRLASLRKFYKTHASPLRGVPLTEEHKNKLSLGWTKEKRDKKSQDQKKRIQNDPNCILGMLGKKHTQNTKDKMSSARKVVWDEKRKEIVECPHCGKQGVHINMKRWHFDKCKERNEFK